MSQPLRIFAIVLAAIGIITLAWIGYRSYELYYAPQVIRTEVIQLPTGGNAQQMFDTIAKRQIVEDTAWFRRALDRLGYDYRAGQFKTEEGWSASDLVRHLEDGRQTAAKIILTGGRQIGDVANRATRYLEIDSAALMQAWRDTAWLDSVGLTPETLMSTVIPNTYNVYWNASPVEVRDRLLVESGKFWDKNNRRARADSLRLSPQQVYTLASIVDAETNAEDEMPTIAGVYLNRIRRGIKLDADPTVVFANGDFTLRRVLYKHLRTDSPYNTYMYAGLPPGPIMMASIAAIDATLSPESHDYLFFVTRGDTSGKHSFATDMRGHSANIRAFKRTLRERGIRR